MKTKKKSRKKLSLTDYSQAGKMSENPAGSLDEVKLEGIMGAILNGCEGKEQSKDTEQEKTTVILS